jgi:hypothetical protein
VRRGAGANWAVPVCSNWVVNDCTLNAMEIQRCDSLTCCCRPCGERARASLPIGFLTQNPERAWQDYGRIAMLEDEVPECDRAQWVREFNAFRNAPGGWWLRPVRRGPTARGIALALPSDSRSMRTPEATKALMAGRKRVGLDGDYAYPLMRRKWVARLECPGCRNRPRVKAGDLLDRIEDALRYQRDFVYV